VISLIQILYSKIKGPLKHHHVVGLFFVVSLFFPSILSKQICTLVSTKMAGWNMETLKMDFLDGKLEKVHSHIGFQRTSDIGRAVFWKSSTILKDGGSIGMTINLCLCSPEN